MFGHICRIRPSYYPVLNRYKGIRSGKITSVPFVNDCGSGDFCLFYSKRACRQCPGVSGRGRGAVRDFAPQGAKKHPQQAFQRFLTSGSKLLRVLYYFILLTGVRVTKFCAAPAQGRRSRWAWTKSRSCRFPRRCGGPRQRRWRSWQGSAALPAQGRPVREFSGWRYSHP